MLGKEAIEDDNSSELKLWRHTDLGLKLQCQKM